jgi:hypothetical protein
MKLVQGNNHPGSGSSGKPFLTWFRELRELEREGSPEAAIAAYEKLRTAYPLKDQVYDRLMILYRKTEQKEKEIRLINSAIQLFKRHYGSAKEHSKGKKVTSISRSLSRSLGLTDKKGLLNYDTGPTARWARRKAMLEKKKIRDKG